MLCSWSQFKKYQMIFKSFLSGKCKVDFYLKLTFFVFISKVMKFTQKNAKEFFIENFISLGPLLDLIAKINIFWDIERDCWS